jgi:hypothetical protein
MEAIRFRAKRIAALQEPRPRFRRRSIFRLSANARSNAGLQQPIRSLAQRHPVLEEIDGEGRKWRYHCSRTPAGRSANLKLYWYLTGRGPPPGMAFRRRRR